MVRINLVDPRALADQHLVAEYNEILMLFGYVARYPETRNIPAAYRLGPGHIRFFKNKLRYLKDRHESLKREMKRRGFRPEKSIRLERYPQQLRNDWQPAARDLDIIKVRLVWKLKQKPGWYRYEGTEQPLAFFVEKIQQVCGCS